MIKKHSRQFCQNGFVAITLVVVAGAALLAAGLSSSWLGLSRLATLPIASEGERAAALADACLEITLLELRRDNQFAVVAPASLLLGGDSCIIEVMELDPTTKEVRLVAVAGDAHRRLTATAEVIGRQINLLTWQRG